MPMKEAEQRKQFKDVLVLELEGRLHAAMDPKKRNLEEMSNEDNRIFVEMVLAWEKLCGPSSFWDMLGKAPQVHTAGGGLFSGVEALSGDGEGNAR